MEMVLVILISLIWGSFLNMLAHRLLSGDSLLIARSFCPTCRHAIAWYDLFFLSFHIVCSEDNVDHVVCLFLRYTRALSLWR